MDAYTDEESTQKGSWQPQLVLVSNQHTSNNCGSIAGKCELQGKGAHTVTHMHTSVCTQVNTH